MTAKDIAEPKPTPSAPEFDVIDFSKVTCLVQDESGRIVESKDPCRIDYVPYQDFLCVKQAYLALKLKPQPDSSSIPDEKVCLNCERSYGDHWGPQNHCREGGEETWRYAHPSALPDSAYDSSSTSTEQSCEEWWGNTGNQIFGADAKDAAFAAWNAAKGQRDEK